LAWRGSKVSREAISGEAILGGMKIVSAGCDWPAGSWARANKGVGAGRACQVVHLCFALWSGVGSGHHITSMAGLRLPAMEPTRSSDGFA
jgi:hypothetical protein